MDFLLDPYSWWIEPFVSGSSDIVSASDLRGALLAGLLVILCSSIIGTWITIRGMTFFADALAHGILPGVSIAATLGGNITLGAIIAGIFMVSGIRTVRRFSPLPNDTSIGLLFVGMLALTLVIAGGEEGEEELHGFLFGDAFSVSGGGYLFLGISALIILSATVIFYRPFLVTTFDSVLSQLLRLRPSLAELGLMILLCLSIVASFQVVGSLLVFALLIAPPATAALLHRKIWSMMITAVVQGIVSVYLGLLISFHSGTSGSGAIALTSVGIFFVVLILRTIFTGQQPINLLNKNVIINEADRSGSRSQ